jgi:hypothetical protein
VNKFSLRTAVLYVVASALAASPLTAQTPPTSEPAAEELPPQVTRVDDVPLPVASEIFKTFDKFKDSNWRAVQRQELPRARPRGDQASIALLLGAVIAEGFVAVAAEDAAEMTSLGRSLLGLARGLGVEQWALKRSRSIVDHAESGDWGAVRKEWDQVLPDVHEGMKELKSQQLAHLVSLGGWVRGAEALGVLVSQRYSPEDAELLRQPVLLDHFAKHIATTNDPVLAKATAGIQKFRRIVDATPSPMPAETVKEIRAIAAELLQSFPAESRQTR